MDPSELGFFEKTPGSGIWYHPDKGKNTAHEPMVCEWDGKPFMGHRISGRKGKHRFCSRACRDMAHVNPDAGYSTRHARVNAVRGPASKQTCKDCGQQAAEWSQIHGTTGQEPEHYEPRCGGCHTAYDSETQVRGEKQGNAKLTEARVRGIRASVDENGQPPPARELAEIHGVSASAISAVRNRQNWRAEP